jgi:hypothetical protein
VKGCRQTKEIEKYERMNSRQWSKCLWSCLSSGEDLVEVAAVVRSKQSAHCIQKSKLNRKMSVTFAFVLGFQLNEINANKLKLKAEANEEEAKGKQNEQVILIEIEREHCRRWPERINCNELGRKRGNERRTKDEQSKTAFS